MRKQRPNQLRGNREADQRLWFRYTDSTIPLLLKSKISSLQPSSVAVQPGLCWTCRKPRRPVFSRRGSNKFGHDVAVLSCDILKSSWHIKLYAEYFGHCPAMVACCCLKLSFQDFCSNTREMRGCNWDLDLGQDKINCFQCMGTFFSFAHI